MKYSPFPRRCSHAGHFDSSSFLLSLSFIFLPSSAFDCFLGVYHIELFSLSRKPYSFFSSLSQLINNRESTSLERSTSCLPNRTAGVSPWESSGPVKGTSPVTQGAALGPSLRFGEGRQWGARYSSCLQLPRTACIAVLQRGAGRWSTGPGAEHRGLTGKGVHCKSQSVGSGDRQMGASPSLMLPA